MSMILMPDGTIAGQNGYPVDLTQQDYEDCCCGSGECENPCGCCDLPSLRITLESYTPCCCFEDYYPYQLAKITAMNPVVLPAANWAYSTVSPYGPYITHTAIMGSANLYEDDCSAAPASSSVLNASIQLACYSPGLWSLSIQGVTQVIGHTVFYGEFTGDVCAGTALISNNIPNCLGNPHYLSGGNARIGVVS